MKFKLWILMTLLGATLQVNAAEIYRYTSGEFEVTNALPTDRLVVTIEFSTILAPSTIYNSGAIDTTLAGLLVSIHFEVGNITFAGAAYLTELQLETDADGKIVNWLVHYDDFSDEILSGTSPFISPEPFRDYVGASTRPTVGGGPPSGLGNGITASNTDDRGSWTSPVPDSTLEWVVSEGVLVGARNVNVAGELYDVDFVDGECYLIFEGCDEASDFDFQTSEEAEMATRALEAQVFLDTTVLGIPYNFDATPTLTLNCTNPDVCVVLTPYAVGGLGFFSWDFENGQTYCVFFFGGTCVEFNDFDGILLHNWATFVANGANEIFARWSPATTPGNAVLMQAIPEPGGTSLLAAVQLTGEPGLTNNTVQIFTAATCPNGNLDASATLIGEFNISEFDANGESFLAAVVPLTGTLETYAAARVASNSRTGATSPCVVADADNDSWVRALTVVPTDPGTGAELTADVTGYLDSPGKARWYRFPISPGARISVDLTSLPADYDLTLFKDIGQAFEELNGDEDVDGLNRLSAEYAPSVFSPSVFSPSVFSPSVFSPDAYAPSVFSPSVFSPSVFSPSVFSPSVFSPSVFSPSVFSPSVFSPSVFSPSVFSPSVFSPSVFSPSVFSPDNFASVQSRSLISMSAQAGTGAERVVADTWNNTGYFYARVTGKNGASDIETPFQLRVEIDGVSCAGVVPLPGNVNATAGGYKTIILFDRARIATDPQNSPSDVTRLEARLTEFANRPEVQAVMVDLAQIPHIQQLHAQADQNSACPYAENLTATAIKKVISNYRTLNPDLTYVVLLGSDSNVPFFRYPDQGLLGPEQDYDPPMADNSQSQSSLRLNYILGQDEYGSTSVLSLGDSQFPLPELAVGRLVETAAEMNTMLDAYLATSSGVVDQPASTLVTGYDFLVDAASQVQAQLVAGTLGARNDTLVTPAHIAPVESWTANDLRRELFEESEDIIFLAGHFSANSTLAADYETSALTTELAESSVDFTNSIVFSAGCHSGYNIVDEESVPGVTQTLDWTQAFAQKGATLIAGTGYQYGDTDFVEYSERLYVGFARELRRGTGPVSIGQALVRAKQNYLASTPDMRGLHRKSVLISTVFGLPMLSVNLAGDRILPAPAPMPVATAPISTGPAVVLGLQSADLDLVFSSPADGALAENQVVLNTFDGTSPLTATYLQGVSGVVTNPAEPALPLVSKDVTNAGATLSLRGVGFRGGNWSERVIIPLTGTPTTELRGVHTPFTSPVNFPMRLATANYFDAISGSGKTMLHVTPAQHRVETIGDPEAILREFSDLSFRLYYSDNTKAYISDSASNASNVPALTGPPSMSSVEAHQEGDDIVFSARVIGDPAAGIQGVWVTYTEGDAANGEWQSLDLTQSTSSSSLWSGRLVGAATSFTQLDFMVQAVNGVGLVNLDDNFGAYYSVIPTLVNGNPGDNGTPVEVSPSTIDLFAVSEGTFGSSIIATATVQADGPVAGVPVLFTLGGAGRAAKTNSAGVATVTLALNSTPGSYTLGASFPGNKVLKPSRATQPFTVKRTGTTLVMASGPQMLGIEGVNPGLTATLADNNGTPLLQRTVYFTVEGGPSGSVTIPVITDNIGQARLSELALPAGAYAVTARFLGAIPATSGTLFLTDKVYDPSAAATGLNLGGNIACPTEPVAHKSIKSGKSSDKHKKNKNSHKGRNSSKSSRKSTRVADFISLSGFCYLTHDVDTGVRISDGTLVIGTGVSVKKKIIQTGAGSVRVLQGGFVDSKINESGPGSIVVAGRVDAKLQESGPGRIEITVTGEIDGKAEERDDGNLTVHGAVDGNVTETGNGDLLIRPTGTVTGHAREYGVGVLINDGLVEGKSTQED